jgi:hypothetical protein
VAVDGKLVGVAIVGNPLSATLMDGWTAEVLRVCTIEGAPKGTCSMLYQACWRAWRAMGGRRLITYTLQSESGASLRGANWRVVGQTKPVKDGWRKNDHLNANRTHSPVMLEVKNRWQTDDGSYSPNVKEHATLSAGAHVDHGVEVKSTEDHINKAADRGCCVSTCCASSLLCGDGSWKPSRKSSHDK